MLFHTIFFVVVYPISKLADQSIYFAVLIYLCF